MSKFVSKTSVDGLITDSDKASIPVLDRGFLYGDSVYEVFRTYSGVPLFWEEHYQRLLDSAKRIHMRIMQSHDELLEEIRKTVKATGAGKQTDIYVRYAITRGEGPVDLYPDPELQTRTVIIAKSIPQWNADFYHYGVKLAIPPTRRNPVDALDPNIKGGNYLNNVLCVIEARDLGADDCLILNHQDYVTECANSNVWFVFDGSCVTPSSKAGNLSGLTRRAIHEACKRGGISTREADIHSSQLNGAKECFVSSATREVMPVRSLRLENGETIEFPQGGGPSTREAASLLKDFIQEYVDTHQQYKLL